MAGLGVVEEEGWLLDFVVSLDRGSKTGLKCMVKSSMCTI
jgi:hypothetical protein